MRIYSLFQGETALHLACDKGLTKLVKVLLDNGGNPNSQTVKIINPSGGLPVEFLTEGDTTPVSQQTPLHLALVQGNSEIVSLFLQYKCKQFLYLSISNPLTLCLLRNFACIFVVC